MTVYRHKLSGFSHSLNGGIVPEEIAIAPAVFAMPQPFAPLDTAVAHNDAFTLAENATAGAGRSLFADNGSGADTNSPLAVTAVNGVAASVGQQVTLASGALLTVNADRTFAYDPNHVFDYLAAAGSGATDTSAADSFTYTVAGGSTATATMTITGVDSNDTLIVAPNPGYSVTTPSTAASAPTRPCSPAICATTVSVSFRATVISPSRPTTARADRKTRRF